MESTIAALGGILLNALPTFFLLLFLHFYLKAVFFKPMDRLLEQREEATAGARKRAAESLALAEEKVKQYEETLRHARNEIYREQEAHRKEWKQEQEARLAQAAAESKARVESAREQLRAEAEAAKAALENDAQILAARIADSLLERRVA